MTACSSYLPVLKIRKVTPQLWFLSIFLCQISHLVEQSTRNISGQRYEKSYSNFGRNISRRLQIFKKKFRIPGYRKKCFACVIRTPAARLVDPQIELCTKGKTNVRVSQVLELNYAGWKSIRMANCCCN